MSDDVLSGVILQTSVRILVNVCFNSSIQVTLQLPTELSICHSWIP